MRVKFELPEFSAQEAVRIAKEHYRVSATACPLPSERDQNFHLRASDGCEYVLKIANSSEQAAVLDLQNCAMDFLAVQLPTLALPRVRRSASEESTTAIKGPKGTTHLARLLTYVPGTTLAEIKVHTPEMLYSLGLVLGQIDRALTGFAHPAAQRELKWDISRALWIRNYTQHIRQPHHRKLVERFLTHFETRVLPLLPALRTSVIYNDANDYNLLVDSQQNVIGVIDFGDMVHTQTVCELAVGAAYAMLHKADPHSAFTPVVAGYQEALPLTGQELEILLPLICARLCITVTNAAFQRTEEPGNEYLTISEAPAWELLENLLA